MGKEGHCEQISLYVLGVLTVYVPHWVCHSPRRHVLPRSTLLRLQGALQGHCPKRGLHFMQFPGLSRSGSRVLHRSTHSVGCVFCALPRSKQLRQLGAWRAHCPRWAVHLNHLPGPSHFVSRVLHESTASDVLCVSSGELISGCDPTGRCQPSRKMWLATGSLLTVWWRMPVSVAKIAAAPCLLALGVALLPLSLQQGWEGEWERGLYAAG